MKIQVIGSDKQFSKDSPWYTLRSFSKFDAFDAFDLTIVSFQNEDIWRNRGNDCNTVDVANDLRSLAQAVRKSTSCKVIYLFPQNYSFRYRHYQTASGRDAYYSSKPLKDILLCLKVKILFEFIPETINFVFGKSETRIEDCDYFSDFYMEFDFDASFEVVHESIAGGFTTLALDSNHYLSTLELDDSNIEEFIQSIIHDDAEHILPAWLDEVAYLNESCLRQELKDKMRQAEEIQSAIDDLNATFEANKDIKSIVCLKGNGLEEKVRKMLQEILDDVSEFKDEKEEDYCYETGEKIFLFEIKGADGGLRREHVSKTNDHVQIKFDRLEDVGLIKDVKGILIFSDNINTPLDERDAYPDKQITIAKREEILVIPAIDFLRLYERILTGKMDKESFIRLIDSQIGLFELKEEQQSFSR